MGNAHDCARVLCLLSAFGLPLSAAAQIDPLAEPFGPTFDWRDLLPARGGDGSFGYVLRNCGGEWTGGYSLNPRVAGDINGDGFADLLHNVERERRWSWGVLMGGADRPAVLEVSVVSTNDGFQLPGSYINAYGIAGVGDINGDGFDDVVGMEERSFCGRSCYYYSMTSIVFGRDESAVGPFSPILPRASAEVWQGVTGFARASNAHADVNNDGINDLLVNSRLPYVIFGRPSDSPFPPRADIADIIAQTGGLSIASDGNETRWALGGSAGDLNGDGIDDIAIALRTGDAPRGAYVIFGRPSGDPFPSVLDPTRGDASEAVLFQITDEGWSASGIGTPGDINGDDIDDMVITAFDDDGGLRHYVVFGRHDSHRDPFLPTIRLDELDGDDGFVLRSEDGWNLRLGGQPLGDVNGDDVNDLLLGDAIYFGQEHFRYPPVVHPDDVPAYEIIRFEGLEILKLAPAGDSNGDGVPDIVAEIDGTDCEVAAIIYGRRPPPPCRADMDRDGEITIFDWLTFSTAWEAREPLADVDGDGDYSLLDYLVYQAMFHYGCP